MTVLEQVLEMAPALSGEERARRPADAEGGWTTSTDPRGW